MMFSRPFALVFALIFLCAPFIEAAAEGLKYYSDPVFEKLGEDEEHPMEDILALARDGDARAQFILADMYAKGKGGFTRDLKEAVRWFENSAVHGYHHSFIRLAALAKQGKRPVEAWQWYTLAIDGFAYGEALEFSAAARHALIEEAKLSKEEIARGREGVKAWEEAQRRQLREEREAARVKQQEEKAAEDKVAAAQEKKPPEETKDEQN